MQYYDGVTWRSMNIGAALDANTGIGITTHSCGATNVHNAAVTYESLTDADGNIYRTVQIGTQTWMAENLRTTKYRNGTTISNGTDNVTWQNNSFSGAYCSYNNNTANDCPYGKLYNWHAVNNTNQLCPTGWHVPTDSDWTNLITFLGGESLSGGKMKSTGIQFWESPNLSATNSTGWSGLPGGFRNTIGTFNSSLNIGFFGLWWSSTPFGSSSVSYRALEYSTQNLPSFFTEKTVGCSVRCVKD